MTALPNLTTDDLSTLRRMCALATDDATYTDAVLSAYAQKYALVDKLGTNPLYIATYNSLVAPTETLNPYWITTYDLHATAADVWGEKQTAHVDSFDFNADSASYRQSQQFTMYNKMVSYHRSRRAVGAFNLIEWRGEPRNTDAVFINVGY